MLSGRAIAPRVNEILALRRRVERDRTGLYVIEGTRFILEALRGQANVLGAAICPELMVASARAAAGDLDRKGVPLRVVSRADFVRISASAEPSGLAAVVEQDWVSLSRPQPRTAPLWLALGPIRDGGNLGTLLRTAVAAGVAGVILLDDGIDPHGPAPVRASMGAVLRVPLTRMTPSHLSQWTRRAKAVVVGSSAKGRARLSEVPRSRPVVLMIGGERRGMTRSQRRICDLTVTIPMASGVSSLNVAVATGVLLFGLRSRR